jgi:asparagine synthase (glutamine-hydrolysing)
VPEFEPTSIDSIDWDYLQFQLSALGAHSRNTGLKAVTELLPGRQVRYSGGPGRESCAWPIADIVGCPFESPAAAEDGLRAATAEAVGRWAQQYDSIALQLSGGFDSTVVLGLIREQAPDTRVQAINYVIAGPEGDERAYAEAAAHYHGVKLWVEPQRAEEQRFDLGEARNWLRPHPGALPFWGADARTTATSPICAQAAFTGGGGDLVFGEAVPPSVLAEAVRDHLPIPSLLTIVHDYARMSSDTIWNVGWANIKERGGQGRALSTLLERPNAYLTPESLGSVSWERFVHPEVLELKDRISTAKLHHVLAMHHLDTCNSRHSGVSEPDQVMPLWSQLVLEASLRIPSYWMNPAGRRRGLARRAFRDLVPEMILTRRGKGSITSHVLKIIDNNKPFLRELMLDGHLVRRGILDGNKLEHAFSTKNFITKVDIPGLVPSLTAELWLQSYESHIAAPTHTMVYAL